jgi:hypothetical protein
MSDSAQIFEYITAHLQVIGWPAVVLMAWNLRGAAQRFMDAASTTEKRTAQISDKIEIVRQQNEIISSNHLSHIEKALTEQTPLLQSIDRGIAVLVDRNKS